MSQSWGKPEWTDITGQLVEDDILLITLSREQQRNAYTVAMGNQLIEAFELADGDDSVRAIVVTGAGDFFCAGMDLGTSGNVFGIDESVDLNLAQLRQAVADGTVPDRILDQGGRVARAIHRCGKPVAAAINGPGVGVGATMTLAMDFRLASPNAKIGFVFNRIGIVPEACSTFFLPSLVGMQQALEWFYLASPVTADEALAGGLLRSIHAREDLVADAIALMKKLTRDRSPLAQAITRKIVRRTQEDVVLSAHLRESLAMQWLSMRDGKEGVTAFMEKRPAEFRSSPSEDLPPDFDEWFD